MGGEHALQLQELREALDGLGAEDVLILGPAAAVKLQNAGGDKAPPDTLTAAEKTAADQFLAMLEAATLVAAANGELSEPEVVQLMALFKDLSGGQIPEDHVAIWIDHFLSSLGQEGFEARIAKNAAALKDPSLRRSAFVMAVGLAYIDGEVDEDEIAVFNALAALYEIPGEEAQTLLERVENEILGPLPS